MNGMRYWEKQRSIMVSMILWQKQHHNNNHLFLSTTCVRVCWGLAAAICLWLGSAGRLQAAGRLTSAPGVSLWDQQPQKVCTFHQVMMAEAQEAKPRHASSFKISSCLETTNIPSAKTSHMVKSDFRLVGNCALPAPLGGLE